MSRLAAVLAGLTLLLAACTGVPTGSGPQTIEPVPTAPASSPARPANLAGDPRTIVQSFLAANADVSLSYGTARAYLTRSANSGWQTDTATILADDYTVSTYDPRRGVVTVDGQVLGTLNGNGIYTPNLSGGQSQFVFAIDRAGRQFRISKIPPQLGLLLSDEQFRTAYQQHTLYFWDLQENALIPDLRWSPLDDQEPQLAQWLSQQLADGPRPSLQNAVGQDTFPAQTDVRQISVTLGNPTTTIEIPGSSQLAAGVRNHLAAQLSETLAEPLAERDISITDGGKPVQIPQVSSAVFSASDFAGSTAPYLPPAQVYYLSGGHIHDDAGRLLPIGGYNGGYLTSFAIGQVAPTAPLLIAAVIGSGSAERLYVGTQHDGLRLTPVHGALTRPAFVPGQAEVWIGDGSTVYQVGVGSGTPHVAEVRLPAGSGGGQVLALSLSPEGARVAIVVAGAGGSGQLYVGSVVSGDQSSGSPNGAPVQIGRAWEPLSPSGVGVQDVAWLDSVRLFATGMQGDSPRTFETGADGTEWTSSGLGNLPSAPNYVAAATSANVWVSSADDYVWTQSGTSWVSPGPTGQTPGTAPVYVQ